MHLLSIRTQSTMRFAREKQLKRWSKIKKVRLIVGINPLGKIFRRDGIRSQRERIMHRSLDCALTFIRAPLGTTNQEG